MPKLPMQHFRRAVRQFAATPEAHALAFADTGVTPEDLAHPDFELTDDLLWAASANVRKLFGPGWYFHFPALWGLDVHSHLEGAMRLAPTLGQALDTLERVGSLRWPITRWKVVVQDRQVRVTSHRLTAVAQPDWQMLGVIFCMTMRTILEAAHPHVVEHLAFDLEGEPPIAEAEAERILGAPVAWNAPVHLVTFPEEHLASRSLLGEPRAFTALVAALEAHYSVDPATWTARVRNLLDDHQSIRLGCSEVAQRLGISRRTLERSLASEGTAFSTLLDDALKQRFISLLRDSELNLGTIAERLGYSDESALSRANRRWHGCTAAETRRRLA